MVITAGLKEIKHLFMTYRNGIVADSLRKAGMPYGVIFGLQLPQLAEIARGQNPSAELARKLWADRNVRESRLLAAWLWPLEDITYEVALDICHGLLTREEADNLAFRLLRYCDFSPQLAEELSQAQDPLTAYAGMALKRNLEALQS